MKLESNPYQIIASDLGEQWQVPGNQVSEHHIQHDWRNLGTALDSCFRNGFKYLWIACFRKHKIIDDEGIDS